MTAAVGLGLATGSLLGLLGAGGSILAVPALVFGTGQPVSQAVPGSLLVVGISAATAVVPRLLAREVHWRLAIVFGLAGGATAFGGAAVGRWLDPRVLLFAFAVVMVAAAVRMLRPAVATGGGDCALEGGRWRSCLPKAMATGAAVGFLTGLFGVGGGFLIVPALVLLLGVPISLAIGTSLLVITMNAAAGFAAHLGAVRLDAPTLIFALTAVVGALVAGRFSSRLSAKWLRPAFAVFVLVVAVFVAVQATVNPPTA